VSNQPDDPKLDRFREMVAPELRAGLDALPSFEWSDDALAQVRSFDMRQMMPAPELSAQQASVQREQRFVPGPAGAPDVRVLMYRPPGSADAARPVFFHIHGGGYIIGVPEMNDAYSRSICFEQHCVVVSVDYRLAPETRYPGSLEDCYAALQWMYASAAELGIDRSRIAIGGESAGGGTPPHSRFLPATVAKYRSDFNCSILRCSMIAPAAVQSRIPMAENSSGHPRVIVLAGARC
jgi:acetyl esterase/lipase